MKMYLANNSIIFVCLFLPLNLLCQSRFQIKVNDSLCVKCVCDLIRNDTIIATKLLDDRGYITIKDTEIKKIERLRIRSFDDYCYIKNFQDKLRSNTPLVINCQINLSRVSLDEVVVVASNRIIEDMGDKLVYNVSRDNVENTINATDILKSTPLVSIGANGSPSIKGNSSATILINGKKISGLSSGQILSQIPSSEIISVEVITAPSVKHLSSGSAGIINIITRKKINLKTAGNLGAGLGLAGSHIYTNYNYVLSDLNSISSSFSSLIYYPKLESSFYLKDINGDELNTINTIGNNNGVLYYHSLNYSKNNKNGNSFDLYFNYYSSKNKTELNGKNSDLSSVNSNTEGGYDYFQIKADKILDIDKLGELELSIGTSYLPVKNYLEFSDQRIENSSYIKNLTISTDLDFKLSRKIKGSLGAEINMDFTGGKSYFSQRANNIENNFSQKRLLNSSYIEFDYKINNLSKLKFGVRNEGYFIYNNNILLQEISSFFYTLSYNGKITSKNTFSVNFFKRIERPSLNNLLPIVSNSNFILSNIGNPFLRPGLSYTLDIGISNYFGNSFIKISPFLTIIDKKISSFLTYTQKSKSLVRSPINLNKSLNFGLTSWISTSLFDKKININCGFDIISKQFKFKNLKNNGVQFLTKINTSFDLNRHFEINFFGNFSSRDFFIQGSKNPYTYSNISIKSKLSKKLTFSLSVDNPFRKGYNAIERFDLVNVYYSSEQLFLDRNIRLMATYKFGASYKLKRKQTEQKNILDN